MRKTTLPLLLVFAAATLLGACGKKQVDQPPENIVTVTTTQVVQRDLSIVEQAVGTGTSLGVAQALDPTRVRRGTVTVRLPYPEHVARQLRIGQSVRLTSFDDPRRVTTGHIREIRPALDSTTYTMEVIAELPSDREWYSVGSVRGEVVIGTRRGALVVPEQAVVLRPAGTVVYVPEGEIVHERAVKRGLQREGEIELVEGVKPGETVVVDGAALLTDGARIRLRAPVAAPAGAGQGQVQP